MALNKSEIERLLNTEEIVFIATTRADGRPHLVPLWFIYEKGKIYLNTEKISVKFQNILHDNKIALCFGGKETYIIEGSVQWYDFDVAPFPMKEKLYEKYPNEMRDRYITLESLVLEVLIEKELSWHYDK